MNDPVSSPPSSGNLHVHLYSASQSIDVGFDVAATSLTTKFQEFTGVLTSGIISPVPSDLLLRVYADGLNLNCGVIFDNIEIYPTAQPYNASLVRASLVEDPESYDGVDGLLSVAENNGQAVRAAFVLRDQLYFVKEHSIYSTQDDGVNEPADWTLSEVSTHRGHAFGGRRGHRRGLGRHRRPLRPVYFRRRRAGENLAGNSAAVGHDQLGRRAHAVGARGYARQAHSGRRADRAGHAAQSHAGARLSRPAHRRRDRLVASVHSSSYDRTDDLGPGAARKWAPWNIAANSAALIERSDGTAQFFLGNGAGNGQRFIELSDTQLSDDGAAIASYYTTYFFPSVDQEGELGVRAHRKLFSYLDLLRRRGRELEPDFVRGQRGLSRGAAVAGAQFPGKQGPGALYKLARRTDRVSGGHESGRLVVPAVAAGRFACAGSVEPGERRKLGCVRKRSNDTLSRSL